MLDPRAALDESKDVERENVLRALREARRIIDEQTSPNGPRNKDEYAFADAAVIELILGEPRWMDALNQFTKLASKSSYARNVTVDLLKELGAGIKSGDGGAVGSLRARIERAVELAS
jgi:hypothetical protein